MLLLRAPGKHDPLTAGRAPPWCPTNPALRQADLTWASLMPTFCSVTHTCVKLEPGSHSTSLHPSDPQLCSSLPVLLATTKVSPPPAWPAPSPSLTLSPSTSLALGSSQYESSSLSHVYRHQGGVGVEDLLSHHKSDQHLVLGVCDTLQVSWNRKRNWGSLSHRTMSILKSHLNVLLWIYLWLSNLEMHTCFDLLRDYTFIAG